MDHPRWSGADKIDRGNEEESDNDDPNGTLTYRKFSHKYGQTYEVR